MANVEEEVLSNPNFSFYIALESSCSLSDEDYANDLFYEDKKN